MNRQELIRQTLLWESVAAAARGKAAAMRDELTADARAEYAEQGTAPTWRLPDIGTVSLPVSRETVYVADEQALTEWAKKAFPAEVEQVSRIRPAFLPRILSWAQHDGESVYDGEGTVIPGLAVRAGGAPQALSFRPSAAAKAVAAEGAAALVDAVEREITDAAS